MSRRTHVEAGKESGTDPATVAGTTDASPKLVIAADPPFQPPMAAAELPLLDHRRPPRRRRASK
ncbi:MAG TPA: hypothetical protein VN380_08740 [Thermoanaerobaculia bacterium]|nr:hypothetical protein [Thermoanaerobaculia bacterium]